METILNKAIQSAQQSDIVFSKYITSNDAGSTGGHQSGFHIHKQAWPLFFDTEGEKGANKDKFITIRWQDDFETDSRAIYYGSGTRNEYRLTRFGKGFPYLSDENIGDLLIISKKQDTFYEAFVLSADEDIEGFFTAMNMSSMETNGIIPKQFEITSQELLINCFESFIASLRVDFPTTIDIASTARNCYNRVYKITEAIIKTNPDREILRWVETEFQLFKSIENKRYSEKIKTPFSSVEELIVTANTILNRRKSRAGKSLEHHLAEVFSTFSLAFDSQAVTEDNKKPDFLFPGMEEYFNPKYDRNKLAVLASKTTCKDRWRQILNEADEIKTKHLFTLQQGISKNQLDEMYKSDVQLVVPKAYLTSFPEEYRGKILTLEMFVGHIQALQS